MARIKGACLVFSVIRCWFAFIWQRKAQGCRCLVCARPIKAAMSDCEPWDAPAGAVSFDGGWSFGSTIYDALMVEADGKSTFITLVVCDDCLRLAVRRGAVIEVRKDAENRSLSVV